MKAWTLAAPILIRVALISSIPILGYLLTSDNLLSDKNINIYRLITSIITGSATVIIASITLVIARSDKRNEKKSSISDDFWFRTIFMPSIHKTLEDIQEFDRNPINTWTEDNIREFKIEIEVLQRKIRHLAITQKSIAEEIDVFIEGMQDTLSYYESIRNDDIPNFCDDSINIHYRAADLVHDVIKELTKFHHSGALEN